MSETRDSDEPGDSSPNALFDCLSSSRRRHVLGHLHGRAPDSVTRGELAASLAANEHGKPRDRVPNEDRERALTALHHTDLPKLEAAGLIEREADGDAVSTTDHPAFRDPGVLAVIGDRCPWDSESLDALFSALVDPRRRAVLDTLSHQYQPIHTETLARAVGADELGVLESEVPAEDVDRLLVGFTHVHLPILSEAGLIEYDADERTVAYEGHPALRVPWMHSVLAPDFRASLTGESDPGEIGTIEGRERIVSYGQSLCEEADEELFCMFTTTGLLEAGCLTRIRDAADRGVDVYLGTCDPPIREFVRENAPEVTLWEPDTDWLDLPVEEKRVGRLLMSDREDVMLGTLGEQHEDGARDEKAIVGEEADNTLVVMMRQMLSSRLELLDGQAEDVESHLPF